MSVRHVRVENYVTPKNCLIDCPNADELTISKNTHVLDAWAINNIVPLSNMTRITINIPRVPVLTLARMLFRTPHCHTLTLHSLSVPEEDPPTLDTLTAFRYSRNTASVKEVSLLSCTLGEVTGLTHLCTHLQHLSLNTSGGDYRSIITHLLLEKDNTRQLRSLIIADTIDLWIEKLKNIITEVRPQDEVDVELEGFHKGHLWW